MSVLEDLVLLCEGVAAGPDVRLFEAARHALAGRHRIASAIEVFPASSKADLMPTLRALQSVRGPNCRIVAVRDRDFLTTESLTSMRAGAQTSPPTAAYPLARHCLESYLIEPAFVEAAAGYPATAVERLLRSTAEVRVWNDVVRAVLEARAFKARKLRPTTSQGAKDRDTAIERISEALAGWSDDLADIRNTEYVGAEVDAWYAGMAANEPWTRVDGKELMAALERQLRNLGLPQGGGGLRSHLLRHAEQHVPPEPFVAELSALFTALDARWWPRS